MVVDLGSGTGLSTRPWAPVAEEVVGVEPNAAMLRQAEAITPEANVRYVNASAYATGLTDGCADLVTASQSLQWMRPERVFPEIARILRPGGVFYLRDLIFSCDPGQVGAIVEAWLARASRQPDVGWTRPELEIHLREEYSTFNWLLEPMLVRAGFAIREADHAESGLYSSYTCVKLA